jgi:sterol desaturase/sphingolipid hydroxylase (fatty acid hydroxylase superfamily)
MAPAARRKSAAPAAPAFDRSAPAAEEEIAGKTTRSPSLKHDALSLYWITDFAFTSGLVILGVALAGGVGSWGAAGLAAKALWLRCFATLFCFMSAFILTGSCLVIVACGLCGRKQQQAPPPTPPHWREMLDSVKAMWTFAALAAWPYYRYCLDPRSTAIVWTLEEAQPWAKDLPWARDRNVQVALYVAQLVALTLVVDFYSYVKHKSMHSRALFQFHAMHHTYRDPSAFASFAVHPVESFLTFVPVLGMLSTAMPVWAHAYAVWTLGWALLNLYLHCGHELEPVEALLAPLFINTSGFHNSHHELMWTNYGELLYIWDLILDTGFHPGKFGFGRKTLHRTVAGAKAA